MVNHLSVCLLLHREEIVENIINVYHDNITWYLYKLIFLTVARPNIKLIGISIPLKSQNKMPAKIIDYTEDDN